MRKRMILDARSILIGYLCCHKGVGNLILLEIVVQGDEVQTQFLRNDIDRGTAGQRWIHIHHVSIESVAGVCCHMVSFLEVVVALIPVAETYQVSVLQLTTFGNTCGTGSIEQDEKLVRLNLRIEIQDLRFFFRTKGWKFLDILGQQYPTLVFVHDVTQFLVGYQQLGIGILHHEVQTFFRITRIQWLVGASCLQHTE